MVSELCYSSVSATGCAMFSVIDPKINVKQQ